MNWLLYCYEMTLFISSNIFFSVTYFVVNIVTLAFLWWVLPYFSFFYSFGLNIFGLLYLKWVSYRKHIIEFLFYPTWQFLPFNWMFRPFKFNVIINMVRLKFTVLLFVFCLSLFFLVSFYYFSDFFRVDLYYDSTLFPLLVY